MPHTSFAPRLARSGALVAAVAAAIAPVAPVVALALFVVLPGALAAQATARAAAGTAAGVAASALRPDISVPLSVLVRIGTGGRASVGSVLSTVLRVPRRTEPSAKGSAKTRTTPTTSGTATASSSRAGAAVAARVLNTADRYLGTPYVFGGTTPDGFDCSGFVQYVYRKQGVALPRTAAQQSGAGERVRVAVKELRAGDLMLFDASSKRPGIDHVAIYAGNGRMIHSSSSGGGVGYDDLSTKRGRWFVDHMVAARRVVSNGQSLVDALQAWAPAPLDPPDEAPAPSIGKH